VSSDRFLGSNNPIKIFPGRLDDGKVKIQNGGRKVATDRAFEAYMSRENHRRKICMVNYLGFSGFRKLQDISLNQLNVNKL